MSQTMKLSEDFQKLHSFQDSISSDPSLNISLPFVYLNQSRFPVLLQLIRKTLPYSNYIQMLELPYFVNQFRSDLDLIMMNEQPKVLTSPDNLEYTSIILPILFYHHSKSYPLQIFLNALNTENPNATLSLAFAFPYLILPLFEHFIKTQPSFLLDLACLSSSLLPILFPKVICPPPIFIQHALYFFPETGYDIILGSLGKRFNDSLHLFQKNSFTTRSSLICYARAFIADSTPPKKYDVFLQQFSLDIFFSLVFYFGSVPNQVIDDLNKLDFFSPEHLFQFLYHLCCYQIKNFSVIASFVRKTLGVDYPIIPKNDSSNIISRLMGNQKINCFTVSPKDNLFILSQTANLIEAKEVSSYLRKAFAAIDILLPEHYESILQMRETYPIYDVEYISNEFKLEFIESNPAISILNFLFILLVRAPKIPSHTLASLFVNIPLKYIVYQCQHCDNCKKMFPHLLRAIQENSYFLISNSSFNFNKKISIDIHPDEILDEISQGNITEDLYEKWSHCGFLSGPTFYFFTIRKLGSSVLVDQVHRLLSFDDSFFYQPETCKILVESMIEILGFYMTIKEEIIFGLSLLLDRAKQLLENPKVYKFPLDAFVNRFEGLLLLDKD